MRDNQPAGQSPSTDVELIVIGAGYGGLGLGIRLKQQGFEDFVILERAQDVGGTWRDNNYPGVACDVPSHLYSFSFLPNPSWSRVFSPGGEIQDYLRRCARDTGMLEHVRFGAEMQEARWDADDGRWIVTTPIGVWRGRYLVTAAGHLADERLPAVPGIDSFRGAAFHSARWDHAVSLDGKRVGVVGSGASAIQIIPEVARIASELVVFQRSAPYVVPRPDRAYSDGEKRLFARDPQSITELRADIFWGAEYNFAQRRAIPQFLAQARDIALRHLEQGIGDETLRKRLTPDYEIGCKRMLISNDYYPTMSRDNVVLEDSALQEIRDGRVIAASGNSHDLDILIFATGFEATQPPFARLVFGNKGQSLADRWDQGMQACDAISVADFPNLFIINGPNTGLGHNSVVYIIEAQVDYILEALAFAHAHDRPVIEVTREAEDRYMDDIHQRSRGTVWLDGGCKSWYVDPRSGRLTLVWPGFAHSFRDENAAFRPQAYSITN